MEILCGSRRVKVLNSDRRITILIYCPVCRRIVEPDRVSIGRAHIYAVHCGVAQEVAVVVESNTD